MVNPKIPATKWNIQFPTKCVPWPVSGTRRISVNSFGVGGTNAHAILDDAYHYLAERNLVGLHHTSPSVPTEHVVDCIIRRLTEHVPDSNGYYPEQDLSAIPSENKSIHDKHTTSMMSDSAVIKEHNALRIFPFTAFDESGVQRLVKGYISYLQRMETKNFHYQEQILDSLAFTLSKKRSVFPWRGFALADSIPSLIQNLSSFSSKPIRARPTHTLGFVFTGQGAQWYAMGRELLIYPVYRKSLEAAAAYMAELGGTWDLIEELSLEKEQSHINEPYLAHPACTALQIALIDLLDSWGIRPARVVGHSSGEIAAAYCSGRISREAAWKVAYFRGYVSNKRFRVPGAMLAVGLPAAELQHYVDEINRPLAGELIIACFNSPRNNTVSGDESKVDALLQLLATKDVFARKLLVKNAYHSVHMREVVDEYLNLLGTLPSIQSSRALSVEMFSTVSGGRVEASQLNVSYWVQNLVKPVKFMEALLAMCLSELHEGQQKLRMDAPATGMLLDSLIELGPHGALQSAMKETLATRSGSSKNTSFAVLNRSAPGLSVLLDTVAAINCGGYPVDLDIVNQAPRTMGAVQKERHRRKFLVDLPSYCFNHSEGLLYESRLSRNFRLRRHPRHDLFGAPVSDWNAKTPRWRQIFRLSEQPWIKDHVVTGKFVYPGVGYLLAVVEACRQITDAEDKILGFKLRDVSLKRALIIPDDKEGIEVMLGLTKMDESSLWESSIWSRFQISSYNSLADDWIEHCTGYVATDYVGKPNHIDNGREHAEEIHKWQKLRDAAEQKCSVPLDMPALYDSLVTTGLYFGSLFRNLSGVKGTKNGAGEVVGKVVVPDVAAIMPKQYVHEHLIHPATMDSMMHLFLAASLDCIGKKNLDRPMVPTFIKEAWISGRTNPEPGTGFCGHGKSRILAYDKFEADVHVWDDVSGDPRVEIKGIRSSPLDSMESDGSLSRRLSHEVKWSSYLELLTPTSFKSVSLLNGEEASEYRGWINKQQLATLLLVTEALEELETTPPTQLDGHFLNYYDWMKYLRQLLDKDQISGMKRSQWEELRADPIQRQFLLTEVNEHNADGKLAIRMGTNITKVLRREVDPLDLMFGQDDLLDQVYEQVVNLGDLPALQKSYLEIVRDNYTDIKILEVGGGTGSSTAAVLENLAPMSNRTSSNTCNISTYTFTDISAAFFEKAKEKFKDYRDIMGFKTLDAEKDILQQGFSVGSYDFIVAGNVVHATADLTKTLSNLRQLLRPGGRILLHESVRQDLFWSPVAFGQLRGWWLGIEPMRKWSPFLNVPQWETVLKDSGFSGVDLNLKDRDAADIHTQSLIISTAVEASTTNFLEKSGTVTIIVTSKPVLEGYTDPVQALLAQLQDKIGLSNCQVIHYLALTSTDLCRSICISLVDIERTIMSTMTEEEFVNVRQMLSRCRGLLWITPDLIANPGCAMMIGLLRTVRWERDIDDANLISLSISDPTLTPGEISEAVCTLYQDQFQRELPPEKANGEYMFKDMIYFTSRLVESYEANEFLETTFSRPKPSMQSLSTARRPIKLATAAPGLLDKLEWVTDPDYNQELGSTEVEIEIKAVGLNFRDLMIAMGEHMAYSMGNEAAGLVTRVGCEVTDFKIGDRVVYMCGIERIGCFHTFGRVDQIALVHIPQNISFETAASLICVYATVIYGLVDAGRLSKGETILIHAAAGGVGQAAINFAKYVGAEIFCTVSSPEKRDLLMNEYGIPEHHIFSSRDLTFVQGVMRMTNHKGVDLVLNSLSGEALRRSWDLVAPFGRFIEIGKKDAQANGRIELQPFLRNVTMASVELPTMMRHRPELIRRLTQDTIDLFAAGKIKEAIPTKVMNYEQIEEGLRVLQSGRGMGKMVFVPRAEDVIPILPALPPPYMLRADASYVLSGGLGGLGRSISTWMMERGAKNIIFLSRTGNITPTVQQTVEQLKSADCNVHTFKCDVSNEARLGQVLEECRRTMPPIKGVVQGAMVLKDGMFENMTYDTFCLAMKPKVQGSWNLHALLPKDMDFFVMLSSATGIIGNRGQANYAAGNTYQDFLSQYRRSEGLPASTIDLGTILSVGYVAENRDRTMFSKQWGVVLEVIREEEVHALLEYLIDPTRRGPSQLVAGLTTATTYRKRGLPAPSYLSNPLFTQLRSKASSRHGIGDESGNFVVEALLSAASTLEDATSVVVDAVRAKLSSLLAIPVDSIEPSKSVSSNGVDSLVAMEFRTYLAKELQADVPVLDIMGTGSLTDLSRKIASVSKAVVIKEKKTDDAVTD
ncbi:uncharacterized protein A1O9_08435 [Exophiala aquamarina CBS 119918]|uniref:Uncharacterized protein n=1 Tax=Exophiala aquamarina CBS 119918 TaxID=1182545 RepID=A0A072PJJ0_9EURO|nr:uncharacterized protein A1O9_08435 [Exophiala aquamarina CBS 119918]KEF55685.1 hypothetical protein A1O9_08435 [Exophiala aquamarina CBS 119918]